MNIVRMTPLLLSVLLAASASAEISRDDLKKALDANPDLVLSALKKADKMKFFEIVVESQQEYQKNKGQEAAKRERQELEKAFKNPLKPVIGGDARTRGNADAPITIVEYSDFQCPYCVQGYKNLEQLRKTYGAKLRVVFKNFPLDFHPMALPAAQWFEALALQSPEKAWTFHDTLFENQSKLGEDYFKLLAKDLGLDVEKAAKDAKSDAVKNKIEADIKEGKGFGVEGTPAYLINGVPLRGAYPVKAFEEIISKLQAPK
ncbi:MAG: thioredoxin domain-containing protein [Elusimicrobiota bacterium]|nr:MAG: thioredoxin domain-containing protein [Elusimicrobiota bacterium]